MQIKKTWYKKYFKGPSTHLLGLRRKSLNVYGLSMVGSSVCKPWRKWQIKGLPTSSATLRTFTQQTDRLHLWFPLNPKLPKAWNLGNSIPWEFQFCYQVSPSFTCVNTQLLYVQNQEFQMPREKNDESIHTLPLLIVWGTELEAWTVLYLAAKSHTALLSVPDLCPHQCPLSLGETHCPFCSEMQILTSSAGHQGMHDSALLFSAQLEGTCSQWGAVCFTQILSIVISWVWRNKDLKISRIRKLITNLLLNPSQCIYLSRQWKDDCGCTVCFPEPVCSHTCPPGNSPWNRESLGRSWGHSLWGKDCSETQQICHGKCLRGKGLLPLFHQGYSDLVCA